jgi:hypothetical protein
MIKMTYLGGSEKGTCDCTHSVQCGFQNDPDYWRYRLEARARMGRFLGNALGKLRRG